MDGLCQAFKMLAANCESGTMMEGITAEPENNPIESIRGGARTGGRVAGGAKGGKGGRTRQLPGVYRGPAVYQQTLKPYGSTDAQVDQSANQLTASINAISNVLVPVPLPEECGCEPPTRENIYRGMMQTAMERNRWDNAPIDEVRGRVRDMARLGTEDNVMCVPWRVAPRNTTHLPVTTVEGEQYDADFVIVAPSPQKYYEGETIVFTPKIAVQPGACLLSVLTTLECKFKACWEMAHLVSLRGKDKQDRLPYSAKLLACLARARTKPDETPWAIIRPFARPPDAIAPAVAVDIIDLSKGPAVKASNPEQMENAVTESLQDVLRAGGAEDTSVELKPSDQLPPGLPATHVDAEDITMN
eukprot:TRINITY_DN4835_c0_g2_i1.p1 TRINITY_DN4835_c0_g2~~TRINITY_DN4835_c0_g2_i1.p1  ORF type:complete len:379 (+),score=103.26 TRINITY_DN4835_c0_g2_i1:62-1138(+)